jgi:hypothetical protein
LTSSRLSKTNEFEVLTEAEDSKKEEAMDGKPNAATGFHHLIDVGREATTCVVDP